MLETSPAGTYIPSCKSFMCFACLLVIPENVYSNVTLVKLYACISPQ